MQFFNESEIDKVLKPLVVAIDKAKKENTAAGVRLADEQGALKSLQAHRDTLNAKAVEALAGDKKVYQAFKKAHRDNTIEIAESEELIGKIRQVLIPKAKSTFDDARHAMERELQKVIEAGRAVAEERITTKVDELVVIRDAFVDEGFALEEQYNTPIVRTTGTEAMECHIRHDRLNSLMPHSTGADAMRGREIGGCQIMSRQVTKEYLARTAGPSTFQPDPPVEEEPAEVADTVKPDAPATILSGNTQPVRQPNAVN